MKRIACLLVLCAACFHTHSVGKQDDDSGKDEKQEKSEKQDKPQQKAALHSAKPSQVRNPQEPGGPPLSAGPAGLFVPGGVERVQNALAGKGYLDMSKAKKGDIDAETSAAVRRFQSDQGIARTGNPDHETLRRLGLDPDELMRRSQDAKDARN
jgi:hypothetical protein